MSIVSRMKPQTGEWINKINIKYGSYEIRTNTNGVYKNHQKSQEKIGLYEITTDTDENEGRQPFLFFSFSLLLFNLTQILFIDLFFRV